MSKIKLVTFDATNTLFKVHRSVGELYAQAALVHGINADAHKLETNFRKSFHHFNTIYPNFGQIAGISSREWWRQVVKGSFDCYRIKPAIFEKISTDLYDNFNQSSYWDVFPDVVPVLKELNQKGVKLGVVSNFDERLPKIMEVLNLKEFFQFIVTSRETVYYKPSIEIFNHALSLAQLHATDAVHVGDNLELDYKAVRKAGMKAFLLLRQPTDTKVNHLLENNVPMEKIINNLQMLCKEI